MPVSPTILILNGLLQYQTALSLPTPTSILVNDLQALGFRVIVDTHFLWAHSDEEPVVVIGHSQGGGSALQFAARMKREVKFNPLVITFDAVPVVRCPVSHCINFQTAQYRALAIPGAQNIDADLPAVPLVSHTYMPLSPDVRAKVRRLVAPLAKPMR